MTQRTLLKPTRPVEPPRAELGGRETKLPAVPRPAYRRPAEQEMKILLLDIESAPNVALVWGLWDQNIPAGHLLQSGYTLCWAAKWYGSTEMHFRSHWADGAERMAEEMWHLMNEADAIVTYNGLRYDIPLLEKNFLLQGLQPPSASKQIDLYQTVKRRFKFESNKLDYVCQQLKLGAKEKHKGMPLWQGCMNGDEASHRKMASYNQRDVRLLQRLYNRVLPWIKNHPNHGLWIDDADGLSCRNCGSRRVVAEGTVRTATMTYPGYRCTNCGTSMRGRKAEKRANPNVLV